MKGAPKDVNPPADSRPRKVCSREGKRFVVQMVADIVDSVTQPVGMSLHRWPTKFLINGEVVRLPRGHFIYELHIQDGPDLLAYRCEVIKPWSESRGEGELESLIQQCERQNIDHKQAVVIDAPKKLWYSNHVLRSLIHESVSATQGPQFDAEYEIKNITSADKIAPFELGDWIEIYSMRFANTEPASIAVETAH